MAFAPRTPEWVSQSQFPIPTPTLTTLRLHHQQGPAFRRAVRLRGSGKSALLPSFQQPPPYFAFFCTLTYSHTPLT